MAIITIYNAARGGMDMSHWKDGVAFFSTFGAPEYDLLSETWLDYNTVEVTMYSGDTDTFTYAIGYADDVGTGVIISDIYYFDDDARMSLSLEFIDTFVSYHDLQFDTGSWSAFGLFGDDRIEGNKYRDIIKGASGDDLLFGNAGDDKLYGERDDDILYGGSGDDRLSGGSGEDKAKGGSGDDRVKGGLGHDKLFGNGGNDELSGNSGDDRIYGGGGEDVIIGGSGDDRLRGNGGGDWFVFKKGDGDDVIEDFRPGADAIEILKGASKLSHLDISRHGSDTVIEFSNVSITLEDVRPGHLDADDFVF